MKGLWDYDRKELEKTEEGRILILERMINYGPDGEKIKLTDVKKYWDKLQLDPLKSDYSRDLYGTIDSCNIRAKAHFK